MADNVDNTEQFRRLSIEQLDSPSSVSSSGDSTPGANSRKRTLEHSLSEPRSKVLPPFPATDLIRESRNEIIKFLKNHYVYEMMPPSGCCIVFDSQLRVSSAFRVLQEQSLSAAPIWDSTSQNLISMLTVTTFIEVLLKTCDENNNVKAEIGTQTIKQWLELIGGTKEKLIAIGPDATLYNVCEQLQYHRLHRLPVVEEKEDDQCVLFIVEHLLLLKFLLGQLETKAAVLSKSIGDLRIGEFDHVITCEMDTPLIAVLRLLSQNNITAIPVIDSSGIVLDQLSRADVLCIARENQYSDLNIQVSSILEIRSKQALSRNPSSPLKPVTCLRTDSLLSVFENLAAHNTHRLIVVDEHQQLQGVVSLADLFRFFLGDITPV